MAETITKPNRFLHIHPSDNVLVALQDLEAKSQVRFLNTSFTLKNDVPAKHKFSTLAFNPGDKIYMYGVLVGEAITAIPQGELISLKNIKHASKDFDLGERKLFWEKPDVERWQDMTFNGYHREDGSVGTANYWVVIPLVFCENRNVEVLKQAFVNKLGYGTPQIYEQQVEQILAMYREGKSLEDLLDAELVDNPSEGNKSRVFPNIDGIKFLTHDLGCGCTRLDSDALCGLLAGYITHPNVAGATVLSLGCQHSQASILQDEILKRDPGFKKPLIILEQQTEGTEKKLLQKAIKLTFNGLVEANKIFRKPAPLSKLCIGLECGGSDGFSGISANPALGFVSDCFVALGSSVILSEFPELCGVEQELCDRCVDEPTAKKFMELMRTYNAKAEADGSGFYANPSPGNIKDGLITDAIKSAGAAKKGGTSPIVAVLDYPNKVSRAGLNLLCTPGNDVESTTAEVAAGANVVLFTTGLGTPTGNPIAPVIKLSTSTMLYNRMPDIIDIDCGTIIAASETIEEVGERIIDFVIKVASGEVQAKSSILQQDDFIPWRRGVSL